MGPSGGDAVVSLQPLRMSISWTRAAAATLALTFAVGTGLNIAPSYAEPDNTSGSATDPAPNLGPSPVSPIDNDALDRNLSIETVNLERTRQLDAEIETQMEQLIRDTESIRQIDDPAERANLSSTAQLDMIRLQSLLEKQNQQNQALEAFISAQQDLNNTIVGNIR